MFFVEGLCDSPILTLISFHQLSSAFIDSRRLLMALVDSCWLCLSLALPTGTSRWLFSLALPTQTSHWLFSLALALLALLAQTSLTLLTVTHSQSSLSLLSL